MTSRALPSSAAAWWRELTAQDTPPARRSLAERRMTARALGAALQERVRRQVLAHPEARRIFTDIRGGTRADHRFVDAGQDTVAPDGLVLWAETARLLDVGDPFRSVTVAHTKLIRGDARGAESELLHALDVFGRHPSRFVLLQNLGVVRSLLGETDAALGAFRAAASAPGRIDRQLAAVSLCIAGAKLRSVEDVEQGALILRELSVEEASARLRAAISARRSRGPDEYWGFDEADIRILAMGAPELGVCDDWRVA